MAFRFKFILWLALLDFLMSSCMVPLGPTENPSSKLPIQKAAFQTQSTTHAPNQPEMITFPDMVEKQSLPVVDKTPNGQHYTVNLVTGNLDDASIKIPIQGSFQIILEGGGNQRVVLDNDATDGVGRVRLPAKLLDGYIQARGTPNMTLNYDDPLYHVRQDLVHFNGPNNTGQPIWHNIGKRPFPIPADWYSESPHYTLKFTNNGATNISTRWYPTDSAAKPDYPVGMAKIGPEGGVVELPGVGKLELPPGALGQETVIRMEQMLNAPSRAVRPPCKLAVAQHYCFQNGEAYISPLVRIQPFGLELSQESKLKLQIQHEDYYHTRFGRNNANL